LSQPGRKNEMTKKRLLTGALGFIEGLGRGGDAVEGEFTAPQLQANHLGGRKEIGAPASRQSELNSPISGRKTLEKSSREQGISQTRRKRDNWKTTNISNKKKKTKSQGKIWIWARERGTSKGRGGELRVLGRRQRFLERETRGIRRAKPTLINARKRGLGGISSAFAPQVRAAEDILFKPHFRGRGGGGGRCHEEKSGECAGIIDNVAGRKKTLYLLRRGQGRKRGDGAGS